MPSSAIHRADLPTEAKQPSVQNDIERLTELSCGKFVKAEANQVQRRPGRKLL